MTKGFTILELIVAIIIVGVLASLALPRLFSMIEYSRSAEAFVSIASIRSSMERCFLQNNASYIGCGDGGFDELDIDNPRLSPNAHFDYVITRTAGDVYIIQAIRLNRDGGNAGDMIALRQIDAGAIERSGTGAFLNIK